MKFSRTFKKFFFSILGLLFLTGSVWWYLEVWVRVKGEFGEDHHPAQNILIRSHGVLAMAFLMILGYLIHAHIRPGLKQTKQRPSGYVMLGVISFLVLSAAMGLFGPENSVREGMMLVHRYLGAGIPLFLGIHLLKKAKNTVKKPVPKHPHTLENRVDSGV
jgi:hypothetical protein